MEFVKNYLFELVVTGIIAYLIKFTKKQKDNYVETQKKHNATQSGMKVLLKDRIISACHKVKKQEYMYIYEHENIMSMFEEYQTLGGNGTVVKLIAEVEKLPIKTDIN